MKFSLRSAPASRLSKIGRSAALSLALISGAAMVSTAFAPEAMAQRNKKEEGGQERNSKGFATAYQPLAALVTTETPNWQEAANRTAELTAAIENNVDRNVAGNFMLKVGSEAKRPDLQRRGLELIVASGLASPQQLPLYHFYIASFAFNEKDYQATIAALQAAKAAGYTDTDSDPLNDPDYIIMQAYSNLGQHAEALAFATPLAEEGLAAGNPMPEAFLRRALQTAIDTKNAPSANKLALILLRSYDGPDAWRVVSQVALAFSELDKQAELDLLRLMRHTGSLATRQEYISYIETADPRIMSNELSGVLAEGVGAGLIKSSEAYYKDVKTIIDQRAGQDRRELEAVVKEGRSGSAKLAMSAGDVLFSLGDFARAAELYQLALEKGADANVGLTRKGMSLVKAGDYAAAIEALAQVTGPRKQVASLWSVYAESNLPS